MSNNCGCGRNFCGEPFSEKEEPCAVKAAMEDYKKTHGHYPSSVMVSCSCKRCKNYSLKSLKVL